LTSPDWHERAVSWVLPPPAAAWVRLRARVPDGGDGSSVRNARVLIRRGGDAGPFGRIVARWKGPEGEVTVRRVGWDAANGGSLTAVRRAVRLLGTGKAG
jgi:hypothetical protein